MNSRGLILLAEDDPNLAFLVKEGIEDAGFLVHHASNGIDALNLFCTHAYALVLLDVMMPKLDGFSLAIKIRERDKQIPLLFLTAKGMQEDRLSGFRTGADDYLVKPFHMEELLLRMDVFLRRSRAEVINLVPTRLKLGDFTFIPGELMLLHASATKKLTLREANLLYALCKSDGMITREALLKEVWGSSDYFTGRSMDVFISRLRKYLSADPRISLINFHGTGFRLLKPE